jgi:hypothetical protein
LPAICLTTGRQTIDGFVSKCCVVSIPLCRFARKIRKCCIRSPIPCCVCLSVCLFVCQRSSRYKRYSSHAKCASCEQWKPIGAEKWTKSQVQNHLYRGDQLRCSACSTTAKGTGRTIRDAKLYPCAACKDNKGRSEYEKSHLDQSRRDNKYTLACIKCKEREDRILVTIEALDARICRSSCSATWRHRPGCSTLRKSKLRVKEEDLKWLQFREKHRNSARVTDIAYYKEAGLLV